MIDRDLLARTAELAADHLAAVGERHAGPLAGFRSCGRRSAASCLGGSRRAT